MLGVDRGRCRASLRRRRRLFPRSAQGTASGSKVEDAFDPRTSPRRGVDAARPLGDAAAQASFAATTAAVLDRVGARPADTLDEVVLVPVGKVPWWMSLLHSFWDSWVHERDALLPLGVAVPPNATRSRLSSRGS